jgi:hypothetical protein
MSRPPNSGTTGRSAAFQNTVMGGIGGMVGHALGGAEGAVIGAVGAATAPRAVGRGVMSAPVQRMFSNQLIQGAGMGEDARRAALAQALMEADEVTKERKPLQLRVSPRKD